MPFFSGAAGAQTCDAQLIGRQLARLDSVRADQAQAIATLTECGDAAVPALLDELGQTQSISAQLATIDTLIAIGPEAVPDLTQRISDATIAPESRALMVEALGAIAQTHDATTLTIVQRLTERRVAPQEDPLVQRRAALVLRELEQPPTANFQEQLYAVLQGNPEWVVALGTSLALGLVYLAVLWLTPRWLLKLPGKFTVPNTQVELPLGVLLWLKYRPRVLDRWVADHQAHAQQRFLQRPTVADRKIHIPIQLKLASQLIDQLTPDQLTPIFNQPPACLMIVGEGGVGKTSLACQIARWGLGLVEMDSLGAIAASNSQKPDTRRRKTRRRNPPKRDIPKICSHRMLPVLIEQELTGTALLTEIREQLPRNPDGGFIKEELMTALLRRRRVLVILDHVSEMGDDTYAEMKQTLETTSINALIITSRLKTRDLSLSDKTFLEPQKIEGARLSTFIQPYLEAQGKDKIFEDDAEFYRTCTRLSSMMAATLQQATALLVRLYVDQVIEAIGLKTAQLPDNIPDLMLRYLVWLNREEQVDNTLRRDDRAIQRDAKIVAWECLKETYRPTDVGYETVLNALAHISEADDPKVDAQARLTYLDKTLRLVQVSKSGDRLRIILDPVAEYLAAQYLVEDCQADNAEQRWRVFFNTVDAYGNELPNIRGFLLAVRNCCEQVRSLPDEVLEQLNKRANLDAEELEQARRRQRINKLIDDLYDADPKYLGKAIRNLREEGPYARRAIPDLTKVLTAQQKAADLRAEAIEALLKIQTDKAALIALLKQTLADREDASKVRVATIKGLLQVDSDSNELKRLLQQYFEDTTEVGVVRVQAGQGLRQLGLMKKLLVVQIDSRNIHRIELVDLPPTKVFELVEGVSLEIVSIPGGTFLMGSPEGEGEDNERPQHEVTVPSFWMGRVPVTQAQYQAVMQHNPSNFRVDGSNRPVETVSWQNATAFCERLSQRLGQPFRLPTEAEWEYACRAGTTTPFHFGATITTDLANYRGTDWDYGGQIFYSGAYGSGLHGVYREQTTSVGTFSPNRFGLYDMHGNTWEWCQDLWHDDYGNAPNDGSAWLTETNESSHIVRGGSWSLPPDDSRSAYRKRYPPENRFPVLGFRVVWVPA
ncbi:MAG: SUMF1/EgtB/PvdO family nonheme iron enzyme [Leptolyngbyaceae cyanobacterium MO_188.B28]|nr:SUMF1/EgtB/PvdO family nonheme iron enzyme [Leptolyngbyaceae cyanobacterium MO_188.B28]